MISQEGDYIVVVGARTGAVYHDGKWQGFECAICMHTDGLLKRRIGTNDNAAARRIAYDARRSATFRCKVNPKHK